MRVLAKNYMDSEYETSVAELVTSTIYPGAYDVSGQLETAAATADNAAQALGHLVEILADKGLLTLEDIQKFSSSDEILEIKK